MVDLDTTPDNESHDIDSPEIQPQSVATDSAASTAEEAMKAFFDENDIQVLADETLSRTAPVTGKYTLRHAKKADDGEYVPFNFVDPGEAVAEAPSVDEQAVEDDDMFHRRMRETHPGQT